MVAKLFVCFYYHSLFHSLLFQNDTWIDDATRAVFIEFAVYNANLNMHTMIRIVGEFPATGGVIPSFSFQTERLLLYHTAADYVILTLEIILILFILYYIYEEFFEVLPAQPHYTTTLHTATCSRTYLLTR